MSKKLRKLFGLMLLLIGVNLFLTNCEKENPIERTVLSEQEQKIFDEITSDYDYNILVACNLRLNYYAKKTGLTYLELKEFSENKGDIAYYKKKIEQAKVSKGNIVYDMRVYKQLVTSFTRNYPVGCDDVLLRKRLNEDLNKRTSEFLQELYTSYLESQKKSDGHSRRGGGEKEKNSQCEGDEQCPRQQLCCRVFSEIYYKMCVEPVFADDDEYDEYDNIKHSKKGKCPMFVGEFDEVVIVVKKKKGDNSNDWVSQTPPWFWKNRYDDKDEGDFPYYDEKKDQQWFPIVVGGGYIPDDQERETPCETAHSQVKETNLKGKIQELKNLTRLKYESGYKVNKDGKFTKLEPDEKTGNSKIHIDRNTMGYIHTHLNDYEDKDGNLKMPIRMFSPADVIKFLLLVKNSQHNKIPTSDVYGMMVASNGTYMLKFDGKISDIDGFSKTAEGLKPSYLKCFNENPNKEKAFLLFLKNEIKVPGIKLLKIENDGKVKTKVLGYKEENNGKTMTKVDSKDC